MKIQIIVCLVLINSGIYGKETKQDFLHRLKAAAEEPNVQRTMISKSSFSFSIQELIDNAPSIFQVSHHSSLDPKSHVLDNITGYELDLARLHINDLTGLSHLFAITAIQRLMLNSNDIVEIPQGIFKGLKNINLLSLTNNKIQELKADSFEGLSNLKILYLSANKITNMQQGAFNSIPWLQQLYLNNNALTQLPHDIFKSLTKLRLLNCSSNMIDAVADDLLDKSPRLLSISFAGNKLTAIPAHFLQGLSKIQLVSFSGNKLTDIPDEILIDMGKHTHKKKNPTINVGGNAISSARVRALKEQFKKVQVLNGQRVDVEVPAPAPLT